MKQLKRTHIIRFAILAIILLVVNIVGSQFHKRFDLTKEKRFSLSPATKKYVGEMEDIANITIFLQGNLPAGFQRLQDRTIETLNEFNEYSGGKIQYHFENALEGTSTPKEKQAAMQALAQKGVFHVNLQVQQEEDEAIGGSRMIRVAAARTYVPTSDKLFFSNPNSDTRHEHDRFQKVKVVRNLPNVDLFVNESDSI